MNPYDVCVIGAGPAGIAAAIELASHGLSVALIESGTESYDEAAQRLSDAKIDTPCTHSVMDEAVRRGLGGTSSLWGGRCVPLDPIDFAPREFVNGSGWPARVESDLDSHYQGACNFLGVGNADFEKDACNALLTRNRRLSSRFAETEDIRATQLERWSRAPNMWNAHQYTIKTHPQISILSGQTCIGFRHTQLDGSLTEALISATAGGQSEPARIAARAFVLAAGGVESTRLVLNSLRDPHGLKLPSPQFVGRYYMGHPSGKIADIELFGNPNETLFGFERDGETYVRRRITFNPDTLQRERLLNIAFWLDNAPLYDWKHGSGVLSAAYLALTAPVLGKLLAPAAIRKHVVGEHAEHRLRHLMNCAGSPLRTALFCMHFVYQRYLATPRLPGFNTYSKANRYALHFHGEQTPNWNSSIKLSDKQDALGLLKAQISLEWSQQDIDSIIRAHALLDSVLQENGIGRLIYRSAPESFERMIRQRAVDGFHQIGALCMASDPSHGVTDPYGRMYGTSNLYVASSAVFPTSGQANPTLALVALTLRQAKHIAANIIPTFNHA
jgi:choline dehydrogenase-like flavoprotein